HLGVASLLADLVELLVGVLLFLGVAALTLLGQPVHFLFLGLFRIDLVGISVGLRSAGVAGLVLRFSLLSALVAGVALAALLVGALRRALAAVLAFGLVLGSGQADRVVLRRGRTVALVSVEAATAVLDPAPLAALVDP